MGKFLKIGVTFLCGIFLVSGIAFAYPYIEVDGFVNPVNATAVNLGGGITKFTGLEYTFIVRAADLGAEMDFLSLEFENDVFQSLSLTSPYNYNPADWTYNKLTSSTGSLYTLSSAGTTLGIGDKLTFMVDAWVYTDALTDSSFWNEGQIWAQSWQAGDTLGGGDGGSTAPIPEPTTMLLLGVGLVGVAGFGRKKLFKIKKA